MKKEDSLKKPQRCKTHKANNMGYIEWTFWAEAKVKRGEEQKQCPKCFLWFFATEF
jgi:hypothetical protein